VIHTETPYLAHHSQPFADRGGLATDWRRLLPVLRTGRITLRELRLSDARSLCELLTTEEVSRFISPPPTTVEGFEKFIAWTQRERAAGRYVCFGIVPEGREDAVGLFQIRQLGIGFECSEWGFALAQEYWGSGMFVECANAVLAFTFETLGVRRLEARSCVENGRGTGALLKMGAVCEGQMRGSFLKDGVRRDQFLWSILAKQWRPAPIHQLMH
jgi:ribosomal-protein-alanine N-acetyltransferase